MVLKTGFNTASGKYCCNVWIPSNYMTLIAVSIPQAVSTVATCTKGTVKSIFVLLAGFNTASGKYCCNHTTV